MDCLLPVGKDLSDLRSCGQLILSSMRLWRAGAWNRSTNDVLRGLEAVQKESIKLNRITFGNIYRRKRKSEGRTYQWCSALHGYWSFRCFGLIGKTVKKGV